MSKNIKKLIFILTIFTLILIAISTITKAEDLQFSLDETTLNVQLNSSRILSYSNKPIDGNITWKSSNDNVATVDDIGKVTGVGIGTARITATVGNQTT